MREIDELNNGQNQRANFDPAEYQQSCVPLAYDKTASSHLVPGLTLIDQSQASIAEQLEFTSTLAVEDQFQQQRSISELVGDLGHRRFNRRDAAERELVQMGVTAVPQLVRALSSADAEVRRRADLALQAIVPQVGSLSLVSYRDNDNMATLLRSGGLNQPTPAEIDRIRERFNSEITARISAEPFQSCTSFMDSNAGFHFLSPRQVANDFDRLATTQGQQQVIERLNELSIYLNDPHFTAEEQRVMLEQAQHLRQLSNPDVVHDARLNARINAGQSIEDREQLEQYALDTYALSRNEEERRNVTFSLITKCNLHRSERFMPWFTALDRQLSETGQQTGVQMIKAWIEREQRAGQ